MTVPCMQGRAITITEGVMEAQWAMAEVEAEGEATVVEGETAAEVVEEEVVETESRLIRDPSIVGFFCRLGKMWKEDRPPKR